MHITVQLRDCYKFRFIFW